MKLCCGSNLYASFPLETALREMSKIGFRHVDLWACKAICDHVDPQKTTPEEVQELLQRYKMTAVSMTLFLMSDEERRERMKFAAALGIPTVIWEPAQSTDWADHMTNLNPISVPYGRPRGNFSEYIEQLKQDLAYAKSLGLKVGIEVPHCYTFNEYLYQIYKTDQCIDDDALSYIIAPPHANARGYEAEDVYDLVAHSRAYMLYLWDIKKGFSFPESDRAFGAGDEQMPGGGQRNFQAQIDAFAAKGFTGWYNVSCHGTEGWNDLQKINNCLKNAYRLVEPMLQAKEGTV